MLRYWSRTLTDSPLWYLQASMTWMFAFTDGKPWNISVWHRSEVRRPVFSFVVSRKSSMVFLKNRKHVLRFVFVIRLFCTMFASTYGSRASAFCEETKQRGSELEC